MRDSCNYCHSTKWGASNESYCDLCKNTWCKLEYPQIMADNVMKECNYNLHLLTKENK